MAKLTKTGDDTFTFEGSIDRDFQLIFEALELAAASNDQFAPAFAVLAEQVADQSQDWR